MTNSNRIKVIGIGAGCTIVNNMFNQQIKGVDFMVCDTDAHEMENSVVPNKILLEKHPSEDIEQQFDFQSNPVFDKILSGNTKIALIITCVGDPTVLNIVPVIAQLAKKREIITVGIVTIPFLTEGKFNDGKILSEIEKLRKQFDTLLVVDYEKSILLKGKPDFKGVFLTPIKVLSAIVKGIVEVVSHLSKKESDFKYIKTALCNSGTAFVGSSVFSGGNRAKNAIESALFSPLLKDNKITNAKNVLLFVSSGTTEITIDEIAKINDYIQTETVYNANLIMSVDEDENLGESISVTLIATGFDVSEK
jgi:cell division protein FtsZ